MSTDPHGHSHETASNSGFTSGPDEGLAPFAGARGGRNQKQTHKAPPRRRRKARRVHRVVHHLDIWSLAKVGSIYVACGFVITMISGFILWRAADMVGTIDGIEGFMEDTGGYDTFAMRGDVVFSSALVICAVLGILAVCMIILAGILFNLISDLTGGIRLTVIDEDLLVTPARRRAVPAMAYEDREEPEADYDGDGPERGYESEPDPEPLPETAMEPDTTHEVTAAVPYAAVPDVDRAPRYEAPARALDPTPSFDLPASDPAPAPTFAPAPAPSFPVSQSEPVPESEPVLQREPVSQSEPDPEPEPGPSFLADPSFDPDPFGLAASDKPSESEPSDSEPASSSAFTPAVADENRDDENRDDPDAEDQEPPPAPKSRFEIDFS